MTENSAVPGGVSRRTVIRSAATIAGAAALAGVLPDALRARAAAGTPKVPFDLSQIKHVVFLMKENRSFDHYFGTYPGARGFNDTSVRLPNGDSVFRQPDPLNPDGYLEPFHLDTLNTGAAAVPSLSHTWEFEHAAWNNGAMDGFVRGQAEATFAGAAQWTMGYQMKQDLPFHWALADHFALGDAYHCSVLGMTYSNRLMWMTGTLDPQGQKGGPILETAALPLMYWKTAAEYLTEKGYTFKVYQGADNDGEAVLEAFAGPQEAGPDSALFQGIFSVGTMWGDGSGGLGDPTNPTPAQNQYLAFEEDCANGTLPDVSWILNQTTDSEHPPYLTSAGAQMIATKLEALAQNDDLWNSTVFILNYDENDGKFDHVPPPTPDPARYPEEFVHLASPNGTPGLGYPIGAGFRVPLFVISPWTVGAGVYHTLTDHTSCLMLLEAITAAGGLDTSGGSGAVVIDQISQWRRDTFGDFSDVFTGNTPRPAPDDTQFQSSTTAANLAAQQQAATLPLPQFPGADQPFPPSAQHHRKA